MSKLLFTFAATLLFAAQATQDAQCAPKKESAKEVVQPYKADWSDLNRYPQAKWLNELKFGMYFHWNYATIGGTTGHYGRLMYDPNHHSFKSHQKTFGDQSTFGYKDFDSLFTAEKFDAKEWVEKVERSGAKFMVGMAVHHDGFSLYDDSYTEWNSVDKQPHKDIIGELAAESRKKGMKFGASSHLAFNWYFFSEHMWPDKYDAKSAPDLYNIHDPKKGPSPEFVEEWYNRTVELIDKYELDFIWFDWGTNRKEYNANHTKKLTAHYYNKSLEWNKQVAMASKQGFSNEKSRVHDCEQGKFGYIRYPQWMSDCTMNKGWFYDTKGSVAGGTEISAKFWLHQLIDMVSKNGTLLLNLGPKADGSWPENYEKELFTMGDWLKVNGEAVYYTNPWHRYGEGPTHDGDASHYFLGRSLTEKDIRFTRNGDTLYATVCGYTPDKIAIRSLGKGDIGNIKIKKITCLETKSSVSWTQNNEALTLSIPERASKESIAYTFKIEGEGLCPERANEYNLQPIKGGAPDVKRIRVKLNTKGSLSLSEVVAIVNRKAAVNAKYSLSSVDGDCVATLANDGDACGHPNMKSIAKTKVEENPWLDITLEKVGRVNNIIIFAANDSADTFTKYGVVEYYNEAGELIKSYNTPK